MFSKNIAWHQLTKKSKMKFELCFKEFVHDNSQIYYLDINVDRFDGLNLSWNDYLANKNRS